ncbi:hypothetical protein ACWCOV_40790 [Kribbella sp. NPDC002412]
MASTEIHTLNGRDSIRLDLAATAVGATPSEMRQSIVAEHERLVGLLQSAGINYQDLRSALVPQTNRFEGVFIFDTSTLVDEWSYVQPIAQRIIPLLNPAGRHSFLCGDLLGRGGEQFLDVLRQVRTERIRSSLVHSSQLFGVYVNNLTAASLKALRVGLLDYLPFITYVPTDYRSPFKSYFSAVLTPDFVKLGKRVVGYHDGDEYELSDDTAYHWPLADHGYTCRGLPLPLFELFLSYKIEREVLPGFESDATHSLSAISDHPRDLEGLDVHIDAAKYEYIRKAHGDPLLKAGLDALSVPQLQDLVHQKIRQNYLYDLRFNDEFSIASFSLVIEIPGSEGTDPRRLKVVLKYEPELSRLAVITLM